MKNAFAQGCVALAVSLAALCATADIPQYGTCAHVSRDEFKDRVRTFASLAKSGVRYLRTDFDWSSLEIQRGVWKFDVMDRVVADAEKAGIQLLPLLGYGTGFANPAHEHLTEWTNYVQTVLTRYRGKFPVVEVWNEPNLGGFWMKPSPENYAKLLKATYDAVKAVSPQTRVAISGFSQVPLDFIEKIYKAVGKDCFDIMNVHPYSWPIPPEGSLDVNIDQLRKLMAKYGDGDKPIWITEIGWPNAHGKLAAPGLIRAGLAVVYPDGRPQKALLADIAPAGTAPKRKTQELILKELPPGSRVDYCTAGELPRILKTKQYDVVVNPLSLERSLVNSVDAIADFVAKGGTFVTFGGSVMYYSIREDAEGVLRPDYAVDSSAQRRKLRIGYDAAARARGQTSATVWPTREAVTSMDDPNRRYHAERFVAPGQLEPGDRFIPLLAELEVKGNTNRVVAAAVHKFNGSWKGAIVISGLFEFNVGADDEVSQASRLARSLGIAFDRELECFFNYEFRAPEKDDTDPESHFGMVHKDFSPKLAMTAYEAFVRARPSGSKSDHRKVAKADEWVAQWRRPDASAGGMIWLPGSPGVDRLLRFESGSPRFCDYLGRPVKSVRVGDAYRVPITESPVYFVGGALTAVEKPSAAVRTQAE